MKTYLKIKIAPLNELQQDILIASLSESEFYAFDQTTDTLNAYIEEQDFDADLLVRLIPEKAAYIVESIPDQDWNTRWEQDFQPVIFDNFVAVRAKFHPPVKDVRHEIIITPKMSFGTGHHATTSLMISLMREISFRGKSVIDLGTGTGILAILAEKMGADSVLSIDYDEWSIRNAKENLQENRCSRIELVKADNMSFVDENSDIILANITANVLIDNSLSISEKTKSGGVVILSGFLMNDRERILSAFRKGKCNVCKEKNQGSWLAICFQKDVKNPPDNPC